MAEHPIWNVGNRNPSIAETIVDSAGVAIDLTGSTVKFKAREVGTSTLLVDAAVSNVPGADGVVRYDWSAADAATGILSEPRYALVWWEVTTGGKTQDVLEALIEVRAHAPTSRTYVDLEEFKSTAELSGTTFADLDIQRVLESASRSLEKTFGSRWWTTDAGDPDEVRYYSPDNNSKLIYIDDLVELTELATDDLGGTSFGTAWTLNTDFVLEPLNAATDGEPWRRIRALGTSNNYFRVAYPRSVRVTGRFGWETAPEGVKIATHIIASQILKRLRDNPYGIVSFGGEALRISRYDADVNRAMEPYDRRVPYG